MLTTVAIFLNLKFLPKTTYQKRNVNSYRTLFTMEILFLLPSTLLKLPIVYIYLSVD